MLLREVEQWSPMLFRSSSDDSRGSVCVCGWREPRWWAAASSAVAASAVMSTARPVILQGEKLRVEPQLADHPIRKECIRKSLFAGAEPRVKEGTITIRQALYRTTCCACRG